MNLMLPGRLRHTTSFTTFALLLVLIASPMPVMAQKDFASLEEQMTGSEFQDAGLQKLTPEELASLNSWIRKRSLATLDSPRYMSSGSTTAASGDDDYNRPSIEDMEREPIVTRINGAFSGWDGHTVFKLENGMIWAQADKDKFFTRELRNPTVTIEPALFGAWRLKVEGFDEDCKVERIE
jgi:hypothetical protein